MSQKNLSVWLRVIALFIGAAGLMVLFFSLPATINDYRLQYPQYGVVAAVCMAACYIAAVPFVIAVAEFYLIAVRIGRDRSFSAENAAALKMIGCMGLVNTAICFGLYCCTLAVGAAGLESSLMFIIITVSGVIISVAAFSISHIVTKECSAKRLSD